MVKSKLYGSRSQQRRLKEINAQIRELKPTIDAIIAETKARLIDEWTSPTYAAIYDKEQREKALRILEDYTPFRSEAAISDISGFSTKDELDVLEEVASELSGDEYYLVQDFGRDYRKLVDLEDEKSRIKSGQTRMF